ncbi:hypothetical protein SZN_37691, partial [Streptomyces zinciresistens K42]
MNDRLPPAAPDTVAAAVEALTSRLRKKLDAAIEQYAAVPAVTEGGTVSVRCGDDAVVTLEPGAFGAVTTAEQARCTCLLAPRCLHRAAVLSACPVADASAAPEPEPADTGLGTGTAPGAPGAADGSSPSGTDGSAAAAAGRRAGCRAAAGRTAHRRPGGRRD